MTPKGPLCPGGLVCHSEWPPRAARCKTGARPSCVCPCWPCPRGGPPQGHCAHGPEARGLCSDTRGYASTEVLWARGLPRTVRATQTTRLRGGRKPGRLQHPSQRTQSSRRRDQPGLSTRPLPRGAGPRAHIPVRFRPPSASTGTQVWGAHADGALGPGTHQLLLLSKKRTRNSRSPALVCMCSPTLSTSSGGAGIVTPLWWPGTRGIFGSIICRGRTCGSHLRARTAPRGASWAPT